MPPANAKPTLFLAKYRPDHDYLVNPDPTHGRPGLLPARDPLGREVLIKFWPRIKGTDQDDLEQIWRSEIRQLQRLAAVPRAEELFVPMLASGEDVEGFYLVLDPGQSSPLEIFRRTKNPPATLAQPRLPRNRRRLWANVLRAAEGLELLHSQGVIHRNIDPWAIVTSFGDEPDFRITGFEWSMRIAAADRATVPRRPAEGQDAVASFGRDWTNLGLLAAEIVSAPLARVADLALAPSQIADHISGAEGQLLRSMLRLETAERLDGELICRRMGEVIFAITAEAAGHETKLSLAIRLGTGSRVAGAIRRASDNEIETSDMAAQLEFVEADLSSEPYFARVRNNDSADDSFALFGQNLTYYLAPYRQPGSSVASDWEFAVCERAEFSRPPGGFIIGSEAIEPGSLEIANSIEAQRSFPRKRGRVERWDDYLRSTEPKEARKTDLDRMHQAFSLLLLLEMAYAAADVFPVEVLPGAADRAGDLYTLRLASRFDPARAGLSTALDLEAPAIRLTKMLESDDVQEEGSWTLTETGALGDRGQDTEWRFIPRDEESPREILRFEGSSQADVRGVGFLVPPGMSGEIVQFTRRRKALKVLREHTELLRMLRDPRLRIEDSRDPLDGRKKYLKHSISQSRTPCGKYSRPFHYSYCRDRPESARLIWSATSFGDDSRTTQRRECCFPHRATPPLII
jgi:hypothetical protein